MDKNQYIFTKTADNIPLNKDNYSSFFEEMTVKIRDICNDLCAEKEQFQEEAVYEKILEYVASDQRILYSQITSEIFSYYNRSDIINPDERIETMTANLTKLVEYSRKDGNQQKIKEKYNNEEVFRQAAGSMPKVLIKMWDHINLASRQYSDLKQTDEEFREKFNKRFDESFGKEFEKRFKASVGPETEKLQESMNSQLITLVGIFTALAFLVFGGITSLDNVFESAGVPVLKLMAIGSVWGLCVLNMVFVFLYCVERMTKKASRTDRRDSIFQRYPIVFWCNFVIVSIMVFALWIYYLKNRKGLAWLDALLVSNPKCVIVGGTAIVAGIVISGFILLKRATRTKQKT